MKQLLKSFYCLLFALSVLHSGCSQPAYTGAERFALTGIVTLDGEQVDGGTISFIPQSPEGKVAGGPIVAGVYNVPAEQGANVGAHRVEIHWLRSTGKQIPDSDMGGTVDEVREVIPSQYSTFNSQLTADVTSGENKFDFELTSK